MYCFSMASHSKVGLIICLLSAGLLLCSCNRDPYDPVVGPRNPIPGARKYLATRSDVNEADKEAILSGHPCSPSVLAQLAEAPSREVRSLVAENPSLSTELLNKLLKDPEPGVRAFLGYNLKTPRWALLELSKDPDPNVKWGLARNPNWTPEDLRKMYTEHSVAELLLAGNPSTPKDILEQLSKSKDHGVQTALANNPMISEAAVRWLFQEGNSATKKMLVDNPATPKDILEKLANDSDPEVGQFAKETLKHQH